MNHGSLRHSGNFPGVEVPLQAKRSTDGPIGTDSRLSLIPHASSGCLVPDFTFRRFENSRNVEVPKIHETRARPSPAHEHDPRFCRMHDHDSRTRPWQLSSHEHDFQTRPRHFSSPRPRLLSGILHPSAFIPSPVRSLLICKDRQLWIEVAAWIYTELTSSERVYSSSTC